jgi:hypothetical protein
MPEENLPIGKLLSTRQALDFAMQHGNGAENRRFAALITVPASWHATC